MTADMTTVQLLNAAINCDRSHGRLWVDCNRKSSFVGHPLVITDPPVVPSFL